MGLQIIRLQVSFLFFAESTEVSFLPRHLTESWQALGMWQTLSPSSVTPGLLILNLPDKEDLNLKNQLSIIGAYVKDCKLQEMDFKVFEGK